MSIRIEESDVKQKESTTDPVYYSARIPAVQVHVAEIMRTVFVAEFVGAMKVVGRLRIVPFDFHRVPTDGVDCAGVIVRRRLVELLQRQRHVRLRAVALESIGRFNNSTRKQITGHTAHRYALLVLENARQTELCRHISVGPSHVRNVRLHVKRLQLNLKSRLSAARSGIAMWHADGQHSAA